MSRTALILGNGPSVDQLDPALLGRIYSFGSNHIYTQFQRWGRAVDAVVITDHNRIVEIGHAYQDFPGKLYVGDERYIDPPVAQIRRVIGREFVPLRQLAKAPLRKAWIPRGIPVPRPLLGTVFDKYRMSFDSTLGYNFGFSVVISAIQIAAIEGFTRILLTGVDASYPQAKSYATGIAEKIGFVNRHFIANPRVQMEPFLVMAQIYLEERGVDLIDCTPGGKLRFISKGNLTDLVGR
jgi:hypothetical protein